MITIRNSSLPNTTHNKICILSDLEPDDVLALKMLSKIIKDEEILLIVGESKFIKQELGENILSYYGYTNYTVIQGHLSSKDYPNITLNKQALESDALSRNQCLYDNNIQGTLHPREYCTILDEYSQKEPKPQKGWVWEPNTLIICLKPFYELMTIDESILSECVLLLYGSFNIRCMHNKYSKLADFINTSFKHVVLYESFFATGVNNSINLENAPGVFRLLDTPLLTLIREWNKVIMTDCLNTISLLINKIGGCYYEKADTTWNVMQKDLDKLKNRNLKVVESIINAKDNQMVLADTGLISFCFNDIPSDTRLGSIGFNEMGYTTFVESSNPKVYVVSNVSFDDIVAGMLVMLLK